MLIILEQSCACDERERLICLLEDAGAAVSALEAGGGAALAATGLSGAERRRLERLLGALDAVARVVPLDKPLRHVSTDGKPRPVVVGQRVIGGGDFTLIAGPCAVESEERLVEVARAVADGGADVLRGGAYKPRSSPHDFQGLGEEGLTALSRARDASGLPFVTEAVDETSLARVAACADIVQVGARNMHNFELLKRVGAAGRPVLLKRGFSATLEDWLQAAEYLFEAGARDVILCERGIRTFSDHSRFTLDLSIVPVARRLTGLPILVDPSHASGDRHSVIPLAMAAAAVGADGVMVEVHPRPAVARCDGRQALTPAEFRTLAHAIRSWEAGSPLPRRVMSS